MDGYPSAPGAVRCLRDSRVLSPDSTADGFDRGLLVGPFSCIGEALEVAGDGDRLDHQAVAGTSPVRGFCRRGLARAVCVRAEERRIACSQGTAPRGGHFRSRGATGQSGLSLALVAFFIVVSAGQLTRSDGQMGIPVGGSRPEIAASYGRLTTGAFFVRHSGLTLSVPSVEKRNIVGGIDREPAPRVILSDGKRVLRDQLVYPNNPLRYGAVIVHRGPFGFTVPISVESTTGEPMGSSDLFIDIDPAVPSGTSSTTFDLQDQGRGGEVTLTLVAARGPQDRVVLQHQPRMQVRLESASIPVPATATAPGTVALPDGSTLRLGPVGIYSRVVVVNDWSVWWIYALLVIATIGLSVAMLAPHRVVRVLLVDTGSGARLHAIVSNSRRDPLFAARVEDALRRTSGTIVNTEDEVC